MTRERQRKNSHTKRTVLKRNSCPYLLLFKNEKKERRLTGGKKVCLIDAEKLPQGL